MFKQHTNAAINDREANPGWEQGAAMTVIVVQTDQVWIAQLGDCRAIMSTSKGKGKNAIEAVDFCREHKARTLQQDERNRIFKSGFKLIDGKILSDPRHHKPNGSDEILHGCPLTRCFGDLRFKANTYASFREQCVSIVPEINSADGFGNGDWILIGSSGFWELNPLHKQVVKQINEVKFKEVYKENKKKYDAQRAIEYQYGAGLARDTLNSYI